MTVQKTNKLCVQEIVENDEKKRYASMLRESAFSEELLLKNLEKGDLYILFNNEVPISAALVTFLSDRAVEIKNITTQPEYRKQGYATRLIHYLFKQYRPNASAIFVGTPEHLIPFYRAIGFESGNAVERLFVENYTDPLLKQGRDTPDMIYLKYDF